MKRISRHLPSPAMMVSLLAVFLALGGGSFAVASHLKVRASDIQKNAVRSKHIKNQQVKSADVKNDNLRGVDIDEASLDEVPTAADADELDGLTSSFFAPQASAVLDGDPAGGDLNGSTFPNPVLKRDSVTQGKIASGGVGTSEIASSAVNFWKLGGGGTSFLGIGDLSPTVAASSCLPRTFHVSSANVGEVPVIRTRTSVPGLTMIPGAVMEEGRVIVLFCNATASPINPGSGDITVKLIAAP